MVKWNKKYLKNYKNVVDKVVGYMYNHKCAVKNRAKYTLVASVTE